MQMEPILAFVLLSIVSGTVLRAQPENQKLKCENCPVKSALETEQNLAHLKHLFNIINEHQRAQFADQSEGILNHLKSTTVVVSPGVSLGIIQTKGASILFCKCSQGADAFTVVNLKWK